MRRAAISIPSNIAQGQAQRSTKELVHFLALATGSAAELETQILLSIDLGYTKHSDTVAADGEFAEVEKMAATIQRKGGEKCRDVTRDKGLVVHSHAPQVRVAISKSPRAP
jgi:four helix bundle protein